MIREIRKRTGRTQEEIADAASIDQSYLSLLEKGTRVASDDVLNRLATALGVPADVLRPARRETTVSAGTSGDSQ